MQILAVLTFFYTFNSCAVIHSKSDFERFKNTFKEVKLPLSLCDSVVFENWSAENIIDTAYVKKYELIAKHIDKNYPLKKTQEYQCSYIGRYQTKEYVVLMYKTYTTEAGRGNPKIILTTFSNEGIKKDEAVVLWNDAEDPLYSQGVILNIPNNSTIEIKSTVKVNGYLDGKIVPKKVTEKVLNYAIQKDGKIIIGKETAKDNFKDDNPKILDDFPEK